MFARSQVRSTGSEAAEGSGFGEPESGGVRAALHSVRGLGAPRLNRGRRAGGSNTHYRKAGNEPLTLEPYGGPGASLSGALDQGRGLGASRPHAPDRRAGSVPAEPGAGTGGAGQGAGEEARSPAGKSS